MAALVIQARDESKGRLPRSFGSRGLISIHAAVKKQEKTGAIRQRGKKVVFLAPTKQLVEQV